MKKIILLLIISFTFLSWGGALKAQYSLSDISPYLKLEGDLNEPERMSIRNNFHQYIKSKPIPPEALEFFKNNPPADRIMTEGGFELINMTKGAGAQAETWIAIDPNNPDNIIGTANDSRYFVPVAGYRMAAYVSQDGGNTWVTTLTPHNEDVYIASPPDRRQLTIFDPGISFDTRGWAYYCYGFCETLDSDTDDDDNGVFVCVSKDKGMTWEGPYAIAWEIGNDIPFHDRYSIVADAVPGSAHNDNIYVTWQRFRKNAGAVFSRSQDGGENWSPITQLPGGAGNTQSPVPAVGPDGVLYVAWLAREPGSTKAMLQKSTDGGESWWPSAKNPQTVNTCGEQFENRTVLADKQNMRIGSGPVISIDYSNGPRRGWVYIVQAGKDAEGKYGLYLARSKDGGSKWESNIRIDDNELRNDIFLPSISVDPTNGSIAIFYYSSQNDPDNVGVDGYLAYSNDGVNFTNIRLTPETWYLNSPGDVAPQGSADNFYWGDYTSIAAYGGKIYPCFWTPTPLSGNFYSLELYTAILTTAPKAPEALNTEVSSENPDQIILNWTDPVKNVLGGNLWDFNIAVYRSDEKIADVDKGVQTYADAGLVSGQQYDYKLKAVSTDGESLEASISAIAGGAPTPMPPTNIIPRSVENGILLSWNNPTEHIDGSSAYDLSKIMVYIDDELALTVTDAVQAGQFNSAMIEKPIETFYSIKLKAVGKRGETETESDFTEEMIAYAGPTLTEMNETFDDEANIIPYYTNGDWGLTDAAAYSEPNSITDSPDGKYSGGVNTFIAAPVVITQEKSTLSFEQIAIIDESDSDYGELSVSNNFGLTWKTVFWIDKGVCDEFGIDLESSDWMTMNRTMVDYIGDTLLVRFRLYANQFKHFDGWFIDNLRIDDDPCLVERIDYSKEIHVRLFPNPGKDDVELTVGLSAPGHVKIALYDALGAEAMSIVEGGFDAGKHTFPINLSGLANGMYYCRVTLNNGTRIAPLVIAR